MRDKNKALLKEGWALRDRQKEWEKGSSKKQHSFLRIWNARDCGKISRGNLKKAPAVWKLEIAWWHLKGTRKSQWDSSHGWSEAKDEYKLLRKNTGKVRNRDDLEPCKGLATRHTALLWKNDKWVQTWVRIREQSNTDDFVLGDCYRTPDQEGKEEKPLLESWRKLHELVVQSSGPL